MLGIGPYNREYFLKTRPVLKSTKTLVFRFLGQRERIGKTSQGDCKDNLIFERRSKKVGID